MVEGSTLGPLFYINDLSKYLGECKVSSFVIDTPLFYSWESYIDIIQSLQIDLDGVKERLQLNKLTLNVRRKQNLWETVLTSSWH